MLFTLNTSKISCQSWQLKHNYLRGGLFVRPPPDGLFVPFLVGQLLLLLIVIPLELPGDCPHRETANKHRFLGLAGENGCLNRLESARSYF